MPEERGMCQGDGRLLFLERAKRQLPSPVLEEVESWVAVRETYASGPSGAHCPPALQYEQPAGRSTKGGQEKLPSFTSGGAGE